MRLVLLASALASLLLVGWGATATAVAPQRAEVPVLIIDGGLGDAGTFAMKWLGASARVVAHEPRTARAAATLALWSAPSALWWNGTGAPPSYLLGGQTSTGEPGSGRCTARDVVWALDRIAIRHPRLPVMIVVQGAVGLQVRKYLQGILEPSASSRADVAGLVMMGTPNAGLSLTRRFPDCEAWEPFARGAGLAARDLAPKSPFMGALNNREYRLPWPCRVAVVMGAATKLDGTTTDGIAAVADGALPSAVRTHRVTNHALLASATADAFLVDAWRQETRAGGVSLDRVSPDAVDALAEASDYAYAQSVRDAVGRLYITWFAAGLPVTHISTRLAVDTSGSMAEAWSGTTKMAAAEKAAAAFLDSLAARGLRATAPPYDVSLIGFADGASVLARSTDTTAPLARALSTVNPSGNTDVGAALRTAMASFGASPRAATRQIVLVSDGLTTSGLDEAGILAGPVMAARRLRVRVDTVAIGPVEGASKALLRRIAKETGGSFSSADDLLALRLALLRARLEAGGSLVVDRALTVKAGAAQEVVEATAATKGLAMVVVAPSGRMRWNLTLDGRPVPAKEYGYAALPGGVYWFQVAEPAPGLWGVTATKGVPTGRVRVLAAADLDAFDTIGAVSSAGGSGAAGWLIGLALLGAVAVAATVWLTLRESRRGGAQGSTSATTSTGRK